MLSIACSSTGKPEETAVPGFASELDASETGDIRLLSSSEAVQIALTASQDLYDNLRSLGTVGVTASNEPGPKTNLSEVSELFGEVLDFPATTARVWLVEVRLEMVGAPSGSGTSYTLFVIDASTGRLVSQTTSSTPVIRS